MTGRCAVTCGCFRCAISSLSGYGLPALPITKSTGAARFSSLNGEKFVLLIRMARSDLARPRLTRTRFRLIRKHQLPSPPRQHTRSFIRDQRRQLVFLRAFLLHFIIRRGICVGQEKDSLSAVPDLFE